MTIKSFIPYARQSIQADDIEEVAQVLQSSLISRGPRVEAFEEAVARFCGARYGVAFNSGSSALAAAYYAADVSPSDRIFTSPNTFISTISGGMHCQATPIFLDIDRTTGNLDLSALECNLNRPSTRGKDIIVPVHFAGIPVDMCRVDVMIKSVNTVVIEDAAHAFGSTFADGKRVGSCFWSHMTVFSFHPYKNITTGEGGMVMTNDEELSHRLRRFRNNGIERDSRYLSQEPTPWYYEVQELSSNYNFTEFQAALGLSQLNKLENFAAKRRQLVTRYREQLKEVEHLTLFDTKYDCRTAYHLFVVQIDFSVYQVTRQRVMEKLLDGGIGTHVHYIPLYHHPFFTEKNGDISQYFPEMEAYYARALSLPLHCEMTENDVDRVCEALKKALITV